ncbi:MAG: phosphoenolpyruvate--protein phosphotransferase [Clostridiaceae bacterium]|nr:phosphoenolpyruvate--protein phosphotransferase [Clostridiaceae bacterium]
MKVICGKVLNEGIAIGKISYIEHTLQEIKPTKITDPSIEFSKFEIAKTKAIEELTELYEQARIDVGEDHALIFDIHRMLIEDEDFIGAIEDKIKTQYLNARYAVFKTGEDFADSFAAMEDKYMQERAIDIKDIVKRILSILDGKKNADNIEDMSIVISEELTPSETIQLNRNKLLGFATKYGSASSHTAILARTINVPAVSGIDISKEWDGKIAILDGYEGVLYIEPSESILKEKQKRQKQERDKRGRLFALKGKQNITKCGKKIEIFANINDLSEVDEAVKNDAGGIGLLRSEFLYLAKEALPTEEELFNAYKTVAEKMGEKKVIIRTLDIGADKLASYFDLGKEENPALGYRGIRICLTRTELFKTQLRAIYRAGYYGNISVMFPMIISCEEVRRIKEIINEVMKQLSEQNIPYRKLELGIMIETPASVIISDELAKEVDFFSIGTNDLTQYTLAIDRQNPRLEEFYNPHHPAVLRSIETVVKNAHENGCQVGICGELAADTSLTEAFIKMGIDELSVSPAFVLSIREKVRSIDLR